MIDNEDRKAIERIVKDCINEALDSSGVKEAAQMISDSNKLTKEQIMAVKNSAERQRLIKENIDLFKKED